MKRFLRRKLSAFALAFALVASPVSHAREPYERWEGLQEEAYYVVGKDGTVFDRKRSDELVVPASTVKLMTLYLLMENIENKTISLDDDVVMSPKAANISLAYAQSGIRAWHFFSVDFALRALFVYSANDVASAVGAHIAKVLESDWSEQAFVKMMNKKAKELGMKHTVFKDASGINRKNQTTAEDMMILSDAFISRYAYLFDGDPRFEDYPSLKEAPRAGSMKETTNKLILSDNYRGKINNLEYSFKVDGLKTGFTAVSGFCLVASSVAMSPIDNKEYRVTVTYFGASDNDLRNEKVLRLMETAFNKKFQQQFAKAKEKEMHLASNTRKKRDRKPQ